MSSGSHLSKELFELVKSIGESRSKQEEDKIITAEVEKLRPTIQTPNIQDKKMKELLLRAIYIEMLGHDAAFAHIHAINLAQSRNIISKRVGYLACTLFLSEESQLLLLLVATLQRDLQSNNYLEISCALTALCKLINAGMMHAVSDYVVRLINHTNEIVRKKAVTVLHKFVKLNPSLITEYSDHFRRALCDKDPSVMGASLNFFYYAVQDINALPHFKDLVSSFVVILKQIIDHRLPRDYDYHRLPAPWLQIRLLQILGVLGADDQRASEQMYEILQDVMRRADDTGINAGYAIVYQCLQTITEIYPNNVLIESAAQCISRFISSDNHNLKYTGITGLINIVQLNSQYAAEHQMVVVDCLEDNDETLKRITIELLLKMTNNQNIEVITNKLMGFINSDNLDRHTRVEIVKRMLEISEKYAPDSNWYMETVRKIFEEAGDLITQETVNNHIKLIEELREDEYVIEFSLDQFLQALEQSDSVHDTLLQLAAWTMGEFGNQFGEDRYNRIIDILQQALYWKFDDDATKGWVLTALTKLARGPPSGKLRETISKFSASRSEDIQQRCYEYAGSCIKLSSRPDFTNNQELNIDFTLSFLDNYVQYQLAQGQRPYMPERNRRNIGLAPRQGVRVTENYNAAKAFESLRVDAYETPKNEIYSAPRSMTVNVGQTPQPSQTGLNVKNRVWSTEGYAGTKLPEPQGGPQYPNQPPVQSSQPSYQVQPPYEPRKRDPPPKSAKELEKERLAQQLFAGVNTGRQPAPQQTQQRPQNQPSQQNQQSESLLDL